MITKTFHNVDMLTVARAFLIACRMPGVNGTRGTYYFGRALSLMVLSEESDEYSRSQASTYHEYGVLHLRRGLRDCNCKVWRNRGQDGVMQMDVQIGGGK